MRHYTAEQWRTMVKRYAAPMSAESVEKVVAACVANPTWGVFHAGAQVFGTVCACGPCADRRRK